MTARNLLRIPRGDKPRGKGLFYSPASPCDRPPPPDTGLPASPSLCTKEEQGLSHWNRQGAGWQAGPDQVPLSALRTDLIDDAEVRASTPSSRADFFLLGCTDICWIRGLLYCCGNSWSHTQLVPNAGSSWESRLQFQLKGSDILQ